MSPGELPLIDDVPDLEFHEQSFLNFMSQFQPFLMTVTETLSRHLEIEFEGSGQLVPAVLLFNPFVADHVFWIGSDTEYGKSRADDALGRLRRFERWLSKAEFKDLPDGKQRKIIEGVTRLSGPLYFLIVDEVRSLKTIRLRSAIRYLIEHLEACLAAQSGQGGKFRAFRTALALRAIFEVHSDLAITDGEKYGAPAGPFCKCLEEVFRLGRIEGGFRHYTRRAKEVSSDDPLLLGFIEELREAPFRVASQENR